MKILSVILLGSVALSLPACIVVDERGRDRSPVGELTVHWSIAERLDPVDCELAIADRLHLVVFDQRDNVVLEAEPWCEEFGVSVALEEGLYWAEVTLVDDLDQAATLTETLEGVDIISDTELVFDVNFPLGPFL